MNPYCIKLDIAINITTLTIIEITVVLYFLLLLFKFLYAISPPVLNIFVMIFGHFIFLAFNFTSSELLIASIGVIFDAFLAEFLQDSHIVTTDTIILTTIAGHDIPYVNKVPLDT